MIETATPFAIKAASLTARGIKGLRVTPEHIARRETIRNAIFVGDFCEEDAEMLEETEAEETDSLYFDTKSPQLFQTNPRKKSTYTKHENRSFTDSIESYQKGAKKERTILRWNNRIPTKEIRIHLLKVLLPEKINEFRKKLHRTLSRNGFQGIECIELTTRFGKPNNTIHLHILTDDSRSKEELKELVITACERCGLEWKTDFKVKLGELWDGEKFFDYFTKFSKKFEEKVILFKKKTGIQKFSQIGKWFKKGKGEIWKDVKTFMQTKKPEKIAEGCFGCENWECCVAKIIFQK